MRKGKLLAKILAALLLFIAVPFGKQVLAEDGDRFIEKVTMWDSEGNVVTDQVSLEKQYILRYDLISPLQIKLDEADICIPPYMEKGIEYLLPAISKDFSNFTGSIEVKADDSSGETITVATVNIGEDGIPVFVVNTALDKGSVLNGYLEVKVNLNRETIGDADEYTFEIPKDSSVTARIIENEKLPPIVEKEAVEYDADSQTITWRITVQNVTKPMKELYPIRLLDIIGEGQTYVEGSFQIISPAALESEEFQVSGNQLTWQCSDGEEGVTIQYEYRTKVDILGLLDHNIKNDDTDVSVQNVLSASGADGSKLIDDITSSRSITVEAPVNIVKSRGDIIQYNAEEDAAEIEWTITVTNNGWDVKDLTVYDYFEANNATVKLKGEPMCAPPPAENGKGFDPSEGTQNNKYYQWSYHIGDVMGNTAYTITYVTVIDNYSEYLKRNNGTSPVNKAWFSFAYPMGGNEPYKEFYGPAMTASANQISPNILEKTGTYNPATHRITWTIVVNPNQIELPDAVITDKIPSGQKYISSEVTISDNVKIATMVDEESGIVAFCFEKDGLSGRTAVITLVTELEDSESGKWANNWSGSFENFVTLTADVLAEEGVSSTGRASAESLVISKKLGDFNYADHTLPVTITINQNNMELTDVTVTDRLSDYGLTLVKEKGVKIGGILLEEGTETSRPSFRYENGVLEIYPEETLSDKAVITFTAEAADDYIDAHRSEAFISFINRAALTSDQYGEKVWAQDTSNMRNRPLVKHGNLDNPTGIITYTVEFNRSLADLPAGVVLTDTLPDGLLLKQPSVKLWMAEVDGKTGAMRNTGKEASGYVVDISVTGENTVLQISLPEGKQAYILEYDAQIVDKDKAPFVNRAVAVGYLDDGTGEGSASFSSVQVAGARLENLIYFKVRKTDASGQPLAGAVFVLKQGEQQILMGVTGEDGYLIFAGLAPNTEYSLVELQAPAGYVKFLEERIVTTGTEGGRAYAVEEVFVNQEEGSQREDGSADPAPTNPVPSKQKPTPPAPADESFGNGNSTTQNLAPQVIPEGGRLPRTGGFWGSGLMYVIGAVLAGTGLVILWLWKRWRFKNVIAGCGFLLLVVSAFLITTTFAHNMYIMWKNAREIASFETGMLSQDPSGFQNSTEVPLHGLQEDGQPLQTVRELQDENGVFAVLDIPSISCKETVKEGCDRGTLSEALGHMEETVLPGESGNCIIAGHRNYSFGLHFNRLNEVAVGDEITITTKQGVYTYTVTKIKVVEPTDLSVLSQTEDATLTLITCTPIYVATHRLIVIAQLQEPEE